MSITFGLAIYLIIWWLVLFVILPTGVRTQQEVGEIVPGTPESAPAAPQMLRKLVLTTLVSVAVFAVVYVVIVYKLIDLDRVPIGI